MVSCLLTRSHLTEFTTRWWVKHLSWYGGLRSLKNWETCYVLPRAKCLRFWCMELQNKFIMKNSDCSRFTNDTDKSLTVSQTSWVLRLVSYQSTEGWNSCTSLLWLPQRIGKPDQSYTCSNCSNLWSFRWRPCYVSRDQWKAALVMGGVSFCHLWNNLTWCNLLCSLRKKIKVQIILHNQKH